MDKLKEKLYQDAIGVEIDNKTGDIKINKENSLINKVNSW